MARGVTPAHAKTERNRAVVEAFRAGASLTEVAEHFDITFSRVSKILKAANARPTLTEMAERRRHYSARGRFGRPRLPIDDPDTLQRYVRLRQKCGAAEARKAMGLSQ